MRNGVRILLAVLNLYYELKVLWRHSKLIIPSLTARRQSIVASIQTLTDSVVKSISRARYSQSRYVRRNDQVMNQFDVSL
jgi:hypothetical protein